MKVRIEYLSGINQLVGGIGEEEITTQDEISLAELVGVLASKYGSAFRRAVYESADKTFEPKCLITVNGLPPNKLNRSGGALRDGDRIVLMPIVSGG